MKDKYSAFIAEVSEILGLGKPIDILKLCATTDSFFRSLEKKIAELEAQVEMWKKASENNSYKAFQLENENAELKERNKELLESCEGATMMYNDLCKAKEIIKSLMLFAEIDCREYEEAYKKAENFLNSEAEK